MGAVYGAAVMAPPRPSGPRAPTREIWHQRFRAGVEDDDVPGEEFDDAVVDEDGNPTWWEGLDDDEIRERQEERSIRRQNREARAAQRSVERSAARAHPGFRDFVEGRFEVWRRMGLTRFERREALMCF